MRRLITTKSRRSVTSSTGANISQIISAITTGLDEGSDYPDIASEGIDVIRKAAKLLANKDNGAILEAEVSAEPMDVDCTEMYINTTNGEHDVFLVWEIGKAYVDSIPPIYREMGLV